ncbi:tripartite tricarboxylate transporter TctB family protein [Halovulum sp. GXIMD14793]
MSEQRKDVRMEAGEIARFLSYLVILLASVALFVAAGNIPSSRFEALGASAFPKFVFAAMAFVAVIAIANSLRTIDRDAWGHFGAEAKSWLKKHYLVFVCFALFTAYILAIPKFGFSIASFVFVLGLQIVLMPRRPIALLIAVAVALAFSFGLNALFAEFFNVFLPRGQF